MIVSYTFNWYNNYTEVNVMRKTKNLLSVTIDVELLERLKELAKTENRTLSNLVETILYKYVDKEE